MKVVHQEEFCLILSDEFNHNSMVEGIRRFNVSHPCGNGLIQLNNRKAEGIQRLRRRAKSGPSGISALRP